MILGRYNSTSNFGFLIIKMLPELLCMHSQLLSHVQLFATPWIVAHQAPMSMEFFKQEYWSELPFPSSGDHSIQGSNLHLSPASPSWVGGIFFLTTVLPRKPHQKISTLVELVKLVKHLLNFSFFY